MFRLLNDTITFFRKNIFPISILTLFIEFPYILIINFRYFTELPPIISSCYCFLIVYDNYPAVDALKESYRITEGCTWQIANPFLLIGIPIAAASVLIQEFLISVGLYNIVFGTILKMSALPIGAQVKMGEEIGKTGNTGKMGKRVRRDALHFAILYSVSPEWSNDVVVVTPKDGYFMDPNALYHLQPPYDSQSLVKLEDQKKVSVPYMTADGMLVPAGTKCIWPYVCKLR